MSTQPAAPKPSVRAMACPNCGGTVELRGMGRTLSVACIQCLSILDATTPSLQILQKFQTRERIRPLIPLGVRGKLRGDPYEVIGFQVRSMSVDGMTYSWAEYVLFNPYKGFRYLSEYNGHWNDITPVHSKPEERGGVRPTAVLLGETYKHFQSYQATTTYVMGEFPWKVQVGEQAMCADYINPPRILSCERQDAEVNWSVGEYTPKSVIEEHFGLKGKLPEPVGVFANQPSPHHGKVLTAWTRFLFWFGVLIFVQLFFAVFHSSKTVFSQKYSFSPTPTGEHSFVTDIFELKGRTSNVRVDLRTDLDNDWAYFNMALINADNGEAFAFGRQVSYYHGRDSDGSWTEGKAQDSVVLSSVPAGRYYLRVEPEMETSAPATAPRVLPNVVLSRGVNYRLDVTRDVTTWGFFFLGILLLLIPPVWTTLRSGAFEAKRWAESDYAGGSSGGDSGDDD
jgi:hypothetical protein